MAVVGLLAGTLELIANCDFKFGPLYVLEDEASSSCDAYKIIFLPALE